MAVPSWRRVAQPSSDSSVVAASSRAHQGRRFGAAAGRRRRQPRSAGRTAITPPFMLTQPPGPIVTRAFAALGRAARRRAISTPPTMTSAVVITRVRSTTGCHRTRPSRTSKAPSGRLPDMAASNRERSDASPPVAVCVRIAVAVITLAPSRSYGGEKETASCDRRPSTSAAARASPTGPSRDDPARSDCQRRTAAQRSPSDGTAPTRVAGATPSKVPTAEGRRPCPIWRSEATVDDGISHVSVEPPSPTPAVWRSELNTTERAEHPVEGCADGVGSAVATGRSRLTLGELANVWVDEPGAPFQIALVAEFDATPFQRGDGSVDLRRIRAELVSRAGRVPALRRRVVWRRFGLGRPYWVDDAVFQPEEHVSCASLPVGAAFTDWCAQQIVQPLNRDRPLWRAAVVSGLPGGRFGVLIVVHHAVADGLTGVALAGALLDSSPDNGAAGPPVPHPGVLPRPPVAAGTAARRNLPGRLRRRWRRLADAAADLRTRAPVTSLSRPIGVGRRLATVPIPLDQLLQAGHRLDVTVNDLLLAAVTGGLR